MKIEGVSKKGGDIKSKDAAIDVGIMLVKDVRDVMEGKYIEGQWSKVANAGKNKDQGKY